MSTPLVAPLRCAVLGHPIFHSLSPRAHQAALEAWGMGGASRALDVPPGRVASVLDFLHEIGVLGVNVTAPLKRAAYEACREHTNEASAAGAANCLRRDADGFLATNTDGAGFLDFLREIGVPPESERAALLGGGGSAAGIAAALIAAGSQVAVVARSAERARAYAALACTPVLEWGSAAARSAIESATLVVNTTPLGARASDPSPTAGARLAPGARAIDLRYARPAPAWLSTESLEQAFDGRGLFVAQAARSLAFWFDRTPPLDRLRAVAEWNPDRIASLPA